MAWLAAMLSTALHGAIALAVAATPSLLGGRTPVQPVLSVEIVMQPAMVPDPPPEQAAVASRPTPPEALPPEEVPAPSPPTPVPRRTAVRAVSPARALAPPIRSRWPPLVEAGLETRAETQPPESLEGAASLTVDAVSSNGAPVMLAPETPEPSASVDRTESAGRPGVTREQALNAYSHDIWQRIAARKPKGLSLRGTTLVAFIVAADGHLRGAMIKHSSGNRDLDRLALATVDAAAPFPPLPVNVSVGPLSFAISFDFR